MRTLLIFLLSTTAALAQSPKAKLIVNPIGVVNVSGPQGGPFQPRAFNYDLTANQSWVAVSLSTPPWIACTLSSTRTPATAACTIRDTGLTPDMYEGDISFINTSNGNGSTTRQVRLSVTQPPPAQVLMSLTQNVNPQTYSYQFDQVTWYWAVTNIGTVPANGIYINSTIIASVVCPQTSLGPGERMQCQAPYVIPNAGSDITDQSVLQAQNFTPVTATATVRYVAPQPPQPASCRPEDALCGTFPEFCPPQVQLRLMDEQGRILLQR